MESRKKSHRETNTILQRPPLSRLWCPLDGQRFLRRSHRLHPVYGRHLTRTVRTLLRQKEGVVELSTIIGTKDRKVSMRVHDFVSSTFRRGASPDTRVSRVTGSGHRGTLETGKLSLPYIFIRVTVSFRTSPDPRMSPVT